MTLRPSQLHVLESAGLLAELLEKEGGDKGAEEAVHILEDAIKYGTGPEAAEAEARYR